MMMYLVEKNLKMDNYKKVFDNLNDAIEYANNISCNENDFIDVCEITPLMKTVYIINENNRNKYFNK